MKKDLSKFYLLALFLTLLIIDAWIKRWVNSSLHEPIAVWRNFFGIDFFLHSATNRGAAWGMLAAFYKPLLILRIFVIVALVGYLVKKKPSLKKSSYIVMILAGATGNVIDSFIYGHVIDMFHFLFWGRSYGIFNFADAMIFLGSLGLIFTPKQVTHVNSS